MTAEAGRLIVFEGGEGAGKSTQLHALAHWLGERGIAHRTLREPGGTVLGTAVRGLLLDRESDVEPRAEALLFMASRAQLVAREVRPALQAGEVVLLDRFFLSTYAYQVHGHGLPEEDVRAANRFATGGLVPGLTLLLSCSMEEGLARAARRAASPDRMEALGDAFHQRVAAAFDRFATEPWQTAHPECGPIVRVSASGSAHDVAVRVQAALHARWPGTFPLDMGSCQHVRDPHS